MRFPALLGWLSLLCCIPLFLVSIKSNSKIIKLCREYHFAFGWLMLLFALLHALFSIRSIMDVPFGVLSLLGVMCLNAMFFIKKKKSIHIKLHKWIAVVLLFTLVLHIWMKL